EIVRAKDVSLNLPVWVVDTVGGNAGTAVINECTVCHGLIVGHVHTLKTISDVARSAVESDAFQGQTPPQLVRINERRSLSQIDGSRALACAHDVRAPVVEPLPQILVVP